MIVEPPCVGLSESSIKIIIALVYKDASRLHGWPFTLHQFVLSWIISHLIRLGTPSLSLGLLSSSSKEAQRYHGSVQDGLH